MEGEPLKKGDHDAVASFRESLEVPPFVKRPGPVEAMAGCSSAQYLAGFRQVVTPAKIRWRRDSDRFFNRRACDFQMR